MDAFDPQYVPDPAATLAPDDPLRDSSVEQWMEKIKQDHPELAGQLITNPDLAMKSLADKGIGPPPLSYSDTNSMDPKAAVPMPAPRPGEIADPTANQGPFRLDGDSHAPGSALDPADSVKGLPLGVAPTSIFGRIKNYFSSPAVTPAAAAPSPQAVPTLQTAPVKPAPNVIDSPALDPVAPAAPVAVTPQTKGEKAAAAASDFSKMMAGIKPVAPPPLNAVGTPAVPHPLASGAPNLATLLQVLGAQSTPSPVNTLGRLLVAGKA